MDIHIPNFVLRPYQEEVWDALERGVPRVYAVWHRRSGKDEVGLHWTCVAGHQRKGNYLYLLPEAEHVRRVIWESINAHTGRRRLEEAFPLEVCGKWRENDMVIPLKAGSLVRFAGSDNYNALMGGGFVGVVFSEWALADRLAWAYLKPILDENGGWALFLTVPRGENHAHTMWHKMKGAKDWFHSYMPINRTQQFDAAKLEEIKAEYEGLYGPEEGLGLFMQEMYCDWTAPISGAYYAAQIRELREKNRICRVPYDPALPVDTAWDLGYKDATAIWFLQRHGAEVRAIGYREGRLKLLSEYANWVHKYPYVYRAHYLPLDAEAARLEGHGVTIKEQLEALGVRPIHIGMSAGYAQQISATRALIPRMWIDETECEHGIDALVHYHAAYRQKEKDFAPIPVHDWASHGASALANYALQWAPSQPKPKAWYQERESMGRDRAGWMR